ncbi:hypothetical protein JTE90_002717 [Oedothorax gibbosus]|uniref:NAD(+) ADP-ribosyltransferase n=1 Tax=Oedothorax gibbosus TaxID=931172 RepID=A0AAV6VVR4_9ARAC|nr:hypothetical protein JTE90_002717 [Oedothorax gibbosus]
MDLKLFEELLPTNDKYLMDLHTAASIGCEERVHDIIENAENKSFINHQNSSGWTPLMYAAGCANLRIVGLLLEEGAFTDLKNNEGHTALILASKCGSTDASGAFVNDRDNNGWSALSYASAFGHRSVVQLLVEKGAMVDQGDKVNGMTPLMLSSAAGHEMIVKDFLQLGLNPSVKSKSGDTARSLALKNGHHKVKNLVDAHMCSKRNYQLTNVRKTDPNGQMDLQMLLDELNLTKYYYVFENHGIDINMFFMLTEDDLKEIGIQLLGPRKRMCMAIAEWYKRNLSRGESEDPAFCSKLVLENKRLLQKKEELENQLSREIELRKTADHNLSEGIKTLKNFSDTIQRTMAYTLLLQEKAKQSHMNLKKLVCCTPDAHWTKLKSDLAIPLIDGIDSLLNDIHHHTYLALQQTNFRN